MVGVYILFYLCLINNITIIKTGKQIPTRINIGKDIANFLHRFIKL